MKTLLIRLLTILSIGSILLGFAWADDARVTVVQVQDRSEPGSPFAISGTVEIKETPLDDKRLKVETSENIVARNISGRPILTVVAWLDVKPAYGGPQHSVRQFDCIFAAEHIKPGDEHILSENLTGFTVDPYDSANTPELPRAELRIVYVQFLDGSLFGDLSYGRDIRSLRKQAWHHLKDLDKAYTRDGEAAFLQELSEKVELGGIDGLIANVRKTLRTRGVLAAVIQIRSMLEIAQEHQDGFTSDPDD